MASETQAKEAKKPVANAWISPNPCPRRAALLLKPPPPLAQKRA
uniref:Uncharacterized protein n=1 Tax=Arundo donax TaxID=35708 RepID=A0A0A8ZTG2_ARUDO